MKFYRQFAAVLLVVAAVTALGVAWGHSSAADWITPPGPGGNFPSAGGPPGGAGPGGKAKFIEAPADGRLPAGTRIPAHTRVIRANNNDGALPDLSDVGNLTSTTEIVLAVMAGVVVFEIVRRRIWRARRAARLTAASAAASSPAASTAASTAASAAAGRRGQAPSSRDG